MPPRPSLPAPPRPAGGLPAALTALAGGALAGAALAGTDPSAGLALAAVAAAPAGWLRRVTESLRGPSGPETSDGAALPAEVLDAVPDAFVLVTAGDQVRAANHAVGRLLNVAPEALAGMDLADALVAPAHREVYREGLRRCVETGEPVVWDFLSVVHADGTEIGVELSVRYASKGVFGVCFREARDTSAADAALAAAEGRQRVLRTVVDAIPDAVVAVDRSGGVVLRNRASLRGLGEGAAATAPLPAPARRAAEAVMRSGAPVFDEEEAAGDGVRLTTRIPVRDRAGAVVGLVAISRDVTEQKAAEARLREDKRNAEAAARANSEFLATTSHEIRTLMSGVTGMTALLSGTSLDEEQQSFVDTVQSSSEALLTVINDILDFSKIEAGMLAIEDRPFDVRRTVASAAGMVAQQAAAKGLDLSYEVSDDVPETAHGDAGRVRQVLVNLLSNAVKFTDAGSVRVRVGPAPGDRPALTFAVEDTGVGIAADRLDAVFERFEQADDTTARTHGGTGLGLSICRRLVEMMGGEMSAESVPGEGSTFRFTVAVRADAAPGGEAAAPAPPPAAEAGPAPAPAAPAGPGVLMPADDVLPSARVLIAEDNPVVQRVTLLTLRRLGYRPDVVGNGQKAVEAVRRSPYDVVLMDIMMPVLGGLEATRQILANPGPHPAPAIVALTANAMEGDRQRCLDAGCDEYLAKPVAPRFLAATIEEAMRSRSAAA